MNSNERGCRALLAALCLSIFTIGFAHAQQRPPDAGSLLRETDPTRRAETAPRTELAPASPTTATPRDDARFTVRSFRFTGSQRYSETELQHVVADLVGREVGYLDLRRAADRIADHYRDAGWFARAYLPEQSLQDGVVTIAVIEARVGAVRIDKPAGSLRVDEDIVRSMLLRRQRDADGFDIANLERAALLVDDVPGVDSAIVLAPGANAGTTDIVARVVDTPLVGLLAEADNRGIPATGRERITAFLNIDSALGRGDRVGLLANYSDGNRFGRADFSLPIGADGWRAGISASALEYELGGAFKALDADGRASTYGIDLQYPFVRSNTFNVRTNFGIERRNYKNFALDAETSRSTIDAWRITVAADRLDSIAGGGLMLYSLTLINGNVDLSRNAANAAFDAATAGTDGYYTKVAANIARLQRIGRSDQVSLSVQGQIANRNLDSSEQLSLGGAYGVRAFPELEATGDEGWIASAEWQHTFPHSVRVGLFYDYGSIRQHNRTWTAWNAANPTLRNSYTLDGPGMSVSWTGVRGLEIRGVAATRSGENPARDPLTGHDADGSSRDLQYWLAARWQL